MKTRIKPNIFCLALLIGVCTQVIADTKAELKSTYLDVSKSCIEIASAPEEEGYIRNECLSFPGIRIFNESGDGREWLSFQRASDIERTAITQFGFAHITNGKVEFRYLLKDEKIIPMGVIYRISGTDTANQSNPTKQTQTLVVISFVGKEIHEVTRINGSEANANSKARIALDADITRNQN